MAKRKSDKSLILLSVIILVVLVTIAFGYLQLRTDPFTELLKKDDPIAVLFIVSSDREYRFFEVLLVHPRTHKAAITYVPGNVGSIIESLKRVDRIDALYRREDPAPLRAKVESLIGLDIPFVIDVTEGELARLVDLLDGLDLFIPNPVDLVSGDRRVLLPSGSVVLDGDKAVDFIAYEDSLESDIDQVSRKQKFLQALLKKIGEKNEFLLGGQAFPLFRRNLATNLNAQALTAFVREMKSLDSERVVFQRVLGSKRVVDGKDLVFPHFEGELLKETLKQTLETIASSEMIGDAELSVSLEILNGTDINGLARRAANVFQSFGYEISALGNADNTEYLKTLVLDRKGIPELAQKVAAIIQCERVHTRVDPASDGSVDVTLILGKDFDGRYCKK